MLQTFAVPATLKDVATRARVSESTVSRALSRPDKVATPTRARVLRAAEELGYQPNQMARSLKTRRSQLVGLILADLMNEFHARIAEGVQDVAHAHGLSVMLTSTREDAEREEAFLQELQRHRFRGLIIVPTRHTPAHPRHYGAEAVVEVDRASGLCGVDVVLADNVEPSTDAVLHFAAQGHRRIATVCGRSAVTTGRERLEGYRRGMDRAGLPVDEAWIAPAERHDETDGRRAAARLLALPDPRRPTAVFAFNNEVTAGVLAAAREHGLEVPRDLSVIGFDDSRWARLMTPRLTVVAQPAYQMGRLAAERLVARLDGATHQGRHTRLPTRLIVRDSTAPPPP